MSNSPVPRQSQQMPGSYYDTYVRTGQVPVSDTLLYAIGEDTKGRALFPLGTQNAVIAAASAAEKAGQQFISVNTNGLETVDPSTIGEVLLSRAVQNLVPA